MALRGDDIFRHGRQVMVRVSGPAARQCRLPRAMPAGRRAARRRQWPCIPPRPGRPCLSELRHQFRPGPAAGPAAPALSMRRARSTFICGHLTGGTPVGVLLAITGIPEAGSLARYACHVPASAPPRRLAARCGGDPCGERRRPDPARRGGGINDETVAFAAGSPAAAARPRSSRPRWPAAPGGPARCRCARHGGAAPACATTSPTLRQQAALATTIPPARQVSRASGQHAAPATGTPKLPARPDSDQRQCQSMASY